ncbi:BTAD domain-containing putative transcriptional regulator [Streptomyces sp. NPDC057757]|uniref:AfsR/SARP family transcriptional regulator n=1 Tax=Streptomyces sp. NPDC057757 TaxID=3346241 RepID=UPI003678D5E8
MSHAICFNLLGAMTAHQGDRQIRLGPAKQQCVLAALLIDANRVIPLDALLDRVWHENLPPTGRAVLYSYVARLRRLLPSAGQGAEEADAPAIVRSSGGYMARVYPSQVDLHRFRSLVVSARACASDAVAAGARYRAALALWRGEPLLGLTGPWVEAVRESLAAERTAVLMECHAAELRAGRHVVLLPELENVAKSRPYDEVSLRNLMTALHRSGRSAEAVARYDRTRRLLSEELGIDPSPATQELYQELLRATDTHGLDGPGGTASREPAVRPRPVTRPRPITRPAQLPPLCRAFTGRDQELGFLDAVLTGSPYEFGQSGTVLLEGMAGIGKTTLALQWSHRARDRFPDGQLYVDLHGGDPRRPPLSPAAALQRCLRQLGIPVSLIQGDVDEVSALWRSVVADQRLLLVLDDAVSADQVEPLLPGGRGCATLITSRGRLDRLTVRHDVHPLTVPSLPPDKATELLAALVGPARTDAEPEAAALLAEACGGLPYAFQVLAIRLQRRPQEPLSAMVAQLDQTSPLDLLRTGTSGSTSVRALLDTSFNALPSMARRAFPSLGMLSAAPFRAEEFAAYADCTPAEAREILSALAEEHLLDDSGSHQYTANLLVRCYAVERGRHADTSSPTWPGRAA